MFVKDSKDMGVQFNTSFVGNDKDGYTAGAHLVTSDGLDISNEIKGDCIDDAIQKLVAGLIKKALSTKAEDKKEEPKENANIKQINELRDKLQSMNEEQNRILKDIDTLEKRYHQLDQDYETILDELDDLEAEDDEEDSHPTLDDVLGFDGDFLDYIDSLLK